MSNLTNSSAGRRIASLLDENSFVEIGAKVTARSTDFNLETKKAPGDGVMTGYGLIDGSLVYVYSQDAAVLGGAVGEMHAKKIVNLYHMAMKTGAPVIGLIDSAGLRLEESTDALNAFGRIYHNQAMASGVIPQITAVFGNCGGGLALIPGLTDFTFMESDKAKLFVNSPNAIKGNYEEKKDTAAAAFQSEEAGIVDFTGSEDEIFAGIRELVSFLPSNNEEEAFTDCTDDLNRASSVIASCTGDTGAAFAQIADDNVFLETKSAYGKNMVTGFIRLNGATVGCIANRTEITGENGEPAETFDAVLCPKGVKKATDFVKFCDAFEIPILTLTNVKGYCTCECAEKNIARDAAKLTAAFAEATVPKVNVYIKEAFGTAAIVMNSKSIGADYAYAWNNAKIGAMDARHAAEIMYEGEDPSVISDKAKEYEALQDSAESAAARGYVDTLIDPEDTRKYVIGAFEMLYTKREDRPDKKHGAI
ncbi:MAG: carboxyl transferase [Lachnospiraceae bacterium]|nr:carboxyl transferase [Lachnospiraceae bacterium]